MFPNIDVITLSIVLFFSTLIISFFITKRVRGIAIYYKAYAKKNYRSSHKRITPNIGGVTFYLIFMLSSYFIYKFDPSNIFFAILPGCTILFYIGLKDDLMVLSPKTKFLAQILAAIFLVFHSSFVITDFFGVFNIYNIPLFLGYILSIITVVFIINAFNLIDGIDGLAGLISIAIFIPFGIIFYFSEIYILFLLAVVLTASVVGFLYFNFSKKKKIFMGDCGSLVLGFLIAAMFLRFITMKEINKEVLNLSLSNTIITAISFIFIPFLDTIRVFGIRILNKKSPFQADKNHIHHVLMEKLNLNHVKTSILLFVIQLFTSGLFYKLNYYLNKWGFIIIFLLYLHLFLLFLWALKNNKIITKKS